MLITGGVVALPELHLAYRNAVLSASVETAEVLIAAIVAYLAIGRLRLHGRISDLLIAVALIIQAVGSLGFAVVPHLAESGRDVHPDFESWAILLARVLGSAVLVAAAMAPSRRLSRPPRGVTVMALALAPVGAAAALAAVLQPLLARGFNLHLVPEKSARPTVDGSAALVSCLVLLVVANALAAVLFSRARRDDTDELTRWLGAGSALNAAAWLNYLLFPSLLTGWFYWGDILRVGAYSLFLIGAALEVAFHWREQARLAVVDERRRIARELHDGLAHELAFMVGEVRDLRADDGRVPDQRLLQVQAAAERALDESRRAISALAPVAGAETFGVALAQMAEDLGNRHGIDVTTTVAGGVDVPADKKENLLRIVREAITNAARHGGAGAVSVDLRGGPVHELVVVDDGAGFDGDGPPGSGFGLVSMRERAEAMGGELHVTSTLRHGTTVMVTWP